jgi:hypothetical protein
VTTTSEGTTATDASSDPARAARESLSNLLPRDRRDQPHIGARRRPTTRNPYPEDTGAPAVLRALRLRRWSRLMVLASGPDQRRREHGMHACATVTSIDGPNAFPVDLRGHLTVRGRERESSRSHGPSA